MCWVILGVGVDDFDFWIFWICFFVVCECDFDVCFGIGVVCCVVICEWVLVCEFDGCGV